MQDAPFDPVPLCEKCGDHHPYLSLCKPSEWKVGDVARLNSGGPAMTVESIEDDKMLCTWSLPDGNVTDCIFSSAMLTAEDVRKPMAKHQCWVDDLEMGGPSWRAEDKE